MWTAGGGRRKCHFTVAFGLGVLILPQLLAAAPSQPVNSGRAVHALQSLFQTNSEAVATPLPSANNPWSTLLNTKLPDTKWCGAGATTANYGDLGHAKATDRCCRSHDHCPRSLAPRESRGGFTNTDPFTRLACRCERAFFNCLVEVNTVHSQLVGLLYFNVLKPYCIKDVTPRRGRQRRQQQQQQQLRLVKSRLAGTFPTPPLKGHELNKAWLLFRLGIVLIDGLKIGHELSRL